MNSTAYRVRRGMAEQFPLASLAYAVLAWSIICFVMVAARAEDAESRGEAVTIATAFHAYWLFFVPLMLLSWGLQLAFSRWPSLTRTPIHALLLFAAVIVFFFPSYIIFEGLLGMWQAGESALTLSEHLGAQSRFGWWIDGMLVVATFAFHFGLASRARLAARDADLQRQQRENAELRLALLQGQLEPHFLFNALNGVSSLVRAGKRERALGVLEEIAELLRYALRASRAGMLTMRDEMEFVDRYLSLQEMRFGKRLQVERRIAGEDWSSIPCPPLLVQPLVENALRYGVESIAGDAYLRLSAELADGRVAIEIRNPVGEQSDMPAGNGIGTRLVSERLSAVFGGGGILHARIENREYVVTLSFPGQSSDD